MLRYMVKVVLLGLPCHSLWLGRFCELRPDSPGTIKSYDNRVELNWAVEPGL